MARIGSMQKFKKEERKIITEIQVQQRAVHLKWMELDHITEEMKRAMHDAHFPYVAAGRLTPAIQAVLYKYYEWCDRFYGKKA